MKFYDPKDESDLNRVAGILQQAGIEFSLTEVRGEARSPIKLEVEVAEEDVPKAEELLLEAALKR